MATVTYPRVKYQKNWTGDGYTQVIVQNEAEEKALKGTWVDRVDWPKAMYQTTKDGYISTTVKDEKEQSALKGSWTDKPPIETHPASSSIPHQGATFHPVVDGKPVPQAFGPNVLHPTYVGIVNPPAAPAAPGAYTTYSAAGTNKPYDPGQVHAPGVGPAGKPYTSPEDSRPTGPSTNKPYTSPADSGPTTLGSGTAPQPNPFVPSPNGPPNTPPPNVTVGKP